MFAPRESRLSNEKMNGDAGLLPCNIPNVRDADRTDDFIGSPCVSLSADTHHS